MTEIPEDPGPELLLWGLSHKNYTRIRDWMLGQAHNGDAVANSYELFADRLNNTGVPPLDGEDNWTVSHLQCIRSYMIRHARELEHEARLAETIEGAWAALQIEGCYDDEEALSDIVTPDADAVERWDNEAVAARVLAELMDGTEVKRDTQSGPASSGIHDYDITLPDGRLIALEITQEVDIENRRQAGYIQKHDVESDCLQYIWSVELDHRCDVGPVYSDLPELLARLEELDISCLSVSRKPRMSPYMQKLRELGIQSVNVIDKAVSHSKIHIVPHIGSGCSWHPDALTGVADIALGRKAEKLRRARADERHLWIWIDYSLGPSQMPDPVGRLPSTLPDMSACGPGQGVDVVWVAVAKSPCTVILKSVGTEWTEVELPDGAQQTIAEAIRRSIPR